MEVLHEVVGACAGGEAGHIIFLPRQRLLMHFCNRRPTISYRTHANCRRMRERWLWELRSKSRASSSRRR
eukprot:683772-Rhodomonas_salina.3